MITKELQTNVIKIILKGNNDPLIGTPQGPAMVFLEMSYDEWSMAIHVMQKLGYIRATAEQYWLIAEGLRIREDIMEALDVTEKEHQGWDGKSIS